MREEDFGRQASRTSKGQVRMETLDQYKIKLDAYTGPLDLLLYLVRRQEVDITAVSLAGVTSDYLRYLDLISTLNVEVAGQFLVIAAALMELKSRMLLPTPPPEEEEEWEDPCAELVRQLMEYRRFKEAAEALGDRAEERARRFARPGEKPEAPEGERQAEELREVSLWELLEAFGRLLEATGAVRPLIVTVDDTPQEVVIERLMSRFGVKGGATELTLSQLMEGAQDRGVLISVFLALLELIRRGALRAVQHEPFGDIVLIWQDLQAASASSGAAAQAIAIPQSHQAEKADGKAEPPPTAEPPRRAG